MHNYESSKTQKKVAVIGARGYSGLDLCRLLLSHPAVELASVSATDAGFKLSSYLLESKAASVPTLAVKDVLANASQFHTVFLATPAETSVELAPELLKAGAHVIDLSGAFRLKGQSEAESLSLYKSWYGLDHPAPGLVAAAHYGLVPFCGPLKAPKKAQLIANPGCYVTSVLMALIPLIKAGVIETQGLVIDAKSGTTGAGRKATEGLLFSEVEGECLPYKVANHQHFPEICEGIQTFTGAQIDPMFSTQLLPVRRGIQSALYARLKTGKNAADVVRAYQEAYATYPLARVAEASAPESTLTLSLKRVTGTARTHLTWKADGSKLYVYSCIDNLMKGAASQAVENLNRLLDLPLDAGLSTIEATL